MKNYQIHHILRIRSNVDLPIPKRFLVEDLRDADVVFIRRPLKANLSDVHPVGLRFYRGSGCMMYKAFSNAMLNFVDLHGKFSKVEFTGFYERLRGIREVIEYIISLKLVQKGYAFIHSACLAYRGAGVLLVALSDVGKSSCALRLAQEGLSFLSDDKTILGAEHAYSYPRPVKISKKLWRPILRKLLFLENLSIFYDKIYPEDFVQLTDIAQIKWLFALDVGEKDEIIKIEPNEASNYVELSTKTAYSPYIENLFYTYSYLHPTFNFIKLRDRYLQIVRQSLKRAECFKLLAPNYPRYPSLVKKVISYRRTCET